jgi:FkbM family methyltransferase
MSWKKIIARKRATLKRVGWNEVGHAYWNRLLRWTFSPDSVGTKREDGLVIKYFRGASFHSPEMFNKMGIESFDVALSMKGNVAVDIGAHVGAYTMRLAQNFRFVYAFEPSFPTFRLLQQNIKNNHVTKNVELENMAVSDSSGNKTMQVPEKVPTASTLESKHYEWVKMAGTVAVRAVSLDDYFINGIGKIDFVKIDVEGHELAVLKGMTGIIKKHRPVMSVEVHQSPTALTSCDCNVCMWMKDLGLNVKLHGRYTPEMEAHWLIVK